MYDLDSSHKKPYEILLVAKRLEVSESPANSCNSKASIGISDFPKHKVICSVPSLVHSHKPPLDGKSKHMLCFSKLLTTLQ